MNVKDEENSYQAAISFKLLDATALKNRLSHLSYNCLHSECGTDTTTTLSADHKRRIIAIDGMATGEMVEAVQSLNVTLNRLVGVGIIQPRNDRRGGRGL